MASSSASFGFGFSAAYMMDQVMKFPAEGLPVFLRMTQVDETQGLNVSDFADLGFSVSVTGSLTGSAGTTDYQIIPQPIVQYLPTQRMGIVETQLQVGEVKFTISANWVKSQQAKFSFAHPMLVFRDPRVVGLVFDGEVHSIESVIDFQAGSQIVYWEVTANKAEQNVG